MKGALGHRQATGPLSIQRRFSRPQIAPRASSAAAAPRHQAQPLCGLRSSPLVCRPPSHAMQQAPRSAERGCVAIDARMLGLRSLQTAMTAMCRHRIIVRRRASARVLRSQVGRQDDGDGSIWFRQVPATPPPCLITLLHCCACLPGGLDDCCQTVDSMHVVLQCLMVSTQVRRDVDDAVSSLGAPFCNTQMTQCAHVC